MANLWIRSQDKESLSRPNRLQVAKNSTYQGYRIFNDNFDDVLGFYDTKERCIEIIDEIQKLLQSNGLVIMKDVDLDVIDKDYLKPFKPLFYQSGVVPSDKSEITVHNVEYLVYEMPEE